MSDILTNHHPTKPARSVRKPRDDAVSGYALAAHLGVSRQYVDALTTHGVLTRRSDGLFDQTASRLRYIKHLRTPRSSRSEAEAAHVRAKAEMLQIKIMQQQRKLVLREDVNELLDTICGVVLTNLSGLPARCSRDLTVRREVERMVFEVRTELARACEKLADERREPPLDQQH